MIHHTNGDDMTLATATTVTTDIEASARTAGMRRFGSVVAMVLAPLGFLTANTAYMLAVWNGGSDQTGAEALELYANHLSLVYLGITAAIVGSLLITPAVLGIWRLAPASRTVVVGGSMMIVGYIAYLGINMMTWVDVAMVERGGPMDVFAEVIDKAQANPYAFWVMTLFVLGNIPGTIVLAIGLLRARTVPRWPALAILAWPVCHVIGLIFFPNEVLQVLGAALQLAGFAYLAALRRRL